MFMKNWCRLAQYREIAHLTFIFFLCELSHFPCLSLGLSEVSVSWSGICASLAIACIFFLPWLSFFFFFFSSHLASPALSALFGEKKCELKRVSKSGKSSFLELALCWELLCQLRTLQIPVPTSYGKGHFRVTFSEVQDLLKQTGSLSFALPFPLFTCILGWSRGAVHHLSTSRLGKVTINSRFAHPKAPLVLQL